MKIKEGFVLRTVSDSNVVIPIGRATMDLNGIIKLNGTGVMLWNRLTAGDVSEEELVQLMVDTYHIDEVLAKRDVAVFLTQLRAGNCIE